MLCASCLIAAQGLPSWPRGLSHYPKMELEFRLYINDIDVHVPEKQVTEGVKTGRSENSSVLFLLRQ